ncbi:MAG: AI-2E family transporter [Cyanobacteriota bacterium]|nr:AI-2E family transporter [Cyanobacteriota bacterium]
MNFGQWFGLIALVVSLYILWQIRQLVLLLLTAVILANALNLLVDKFKRLGLKRGYAVLISVVLVFSTVGCLFWLILPSFFEQFQELAIRISESLQRLDFSLRRLERNIDPRAIEFLPKPQDILSRLQPFANEVFNRGWGIFSTTLGGLLNTLLVLVLTLMILANPTPYRQGLIRLFPSFYRRRADEILQQCDRALSGWLAGIMFNMAVIGVFSFIGLLLLGIPLAFSQAVLAAFFTLIPNIGPALSVIPPVAIAFLEDPWKPVAVLLLYIGIQQLEGNVLTPLVMARQVSLLPAITLTSQLIFASVFGFLGLFLALPLTVIGQVLVGEIIVVDVLDPWKKKRKSQSTTPLIPETNLLPTATEGSEIEESGTPPKIDEPSPATES